MSTLYLECYSGISGDMTVGALLDLGADRQNLLEALQTLQLEGYRIEISRVEKNGIEALSFDVILTGEEAKHEHTHTENGHTYTHTHSHPHTHEHGHGERGLKEILPMIRQSSISAKAKETAEKIFRVLAVAEGKVHGMPPEEVVFHEVGAVDSIVDIVSIAVCLDDLGIDRMISSPLYEGTGYVKCRHGLVPVPAPATMELVKTASIPLKITKNEGEMVTPTGAAAVAALADSFVLPESFTVNRIGIGAGKKDFPQANVLRAMLIEEGGQEDTVSVLESDIDDSTPEQLAYAQEALFSAGALDVHFTPVFMKKNRPATELTILCRPEDEQKMLTILFRETTTIGVRKSLCRRDVMERRSETISTEMGDVVLKVCSWAGFTKYYVEYESAAALAKKTGMPLDEIYRKAYAKVSEMSKMQKMQGK